MNTKLDCLNRIANLEFEIEFQQDIDTSRPLTPRQLNVKRQAKAGLEAILGV